MRFLLLPALLPLITPIACAVLETGTGPVVSVSASVDPVDLKIGDTVHIAISIRNTGSRPFELLDQGCNSAFFISDGAGKAYSQAESIVCTLDLRRPVELAPGAIHFIHAFTTGLVLPQGSQSPASWLAPGLYRIRPVVAVRSGNEDPVVVSADPAIVTFR